MTELNDEATTRPMVPERACIIKDRVEAEAMVRAMYEVRGGNSKTTPTRPYQSLPLSLLIAHT
jgi:hypothetical protein